VLGSSWNFVKTLLNFSFFEAILICILTCKSFVAVRDDLECDISFFLFSFFKRRGNFLCKLQNELGDKNIFHVKCHTMLQYDNIFLLCYISCLQFVKPCIVPKPLCPLILFPIKMQYFQYPELFSLLLNNISFVTLPSLNFKRTIIFVAMVILFCYFVVWREQLAM